MRWTLMILMLVVQGCNPDSTKEEDPLDHMVQQEPLVGQHLAEQRD